MAHFIREAGSNLTPIEHSRNLFREQLKLMYFKGMSGKKGSGRSIIMDTTLKGQAGESVVYHFVPHNYGKPLRGQETGILGNEESIEEFRMTLTINEVKQGFRKKGNMTDQRTIFDIRREHSNQLSRWFSQYSEDTIMKVLSGVGFEDDTTDYLSATDTSDRVSGANRCFRADGANGSASVTSANSDNTALVAAMSATDTISCRLIEDAAVGVRTSDATSNDSASAVTNTYKMTPLRIGPNNEEYFCAMLSLQSARNLRYSADWQNHSYSLHGLGLKDSPLAQGALGVWDNVVIKRNERIHRFSDGGTGNFSRNILLGADAMFCGWAKTLDYTEELIDHKSTLSSGGTEIRGESKVTFNGVDLGCAQIIAAD